VDYLSRQQELRLRYLHADRRAHTESFPAAALADNQWHLLALSISSNFVQVFIDCELLFERHLPSIDLVTLSGKAQEAARPPRLWLGQRNGRGRAQFQVRRCSSLNPLRSKGVHQTSALSAHYASVCGALEEVRRTVVARRNFAFRRRMRSLAGGLHVASAACK
jgi:hypothetical protein